MTTHTAWRVASRALCFAAVIVPGLGATPAQAGGTNSVSAISGDDVLWEASAVDTAIARGALPPIVLGSGPGSVQHAAASGQTLTLRSAVAARDGDRLNESATARTEWTFTVDAGSSGLAIGAPVTVQLGLRMDGGLAAGMAFAFGPGGIGELSPDFQFESRAAAFVDLRAVDLDAPGYERGAWNAQFSLGASASVASAWYSAYGGNPEQQYTTWDHGANGFGRDKRGFWDWTGSDSDHRRVDDASLTKELFDFDSGVITLSFDSFVGNRIFLDASLLSLLECNAHSLDGSHPSCAGQADFAHTFDVELGSTTAGIEFGGVTAGIAPAVPEPTTPLLWLAGGAVLAAWRRRGRGRS